MRRSLGSYGKLVLVGVALFGLALIGCEYFDDVVVPTSDNNSPNIFPSVFRGERVIGWTEPIIMETTDPRESFFVIASAVDPGGVHEVTLAHSISVGCRNGSIAQNQHFDLVPMTESVDAEPGDTVSNGLWVGRPISLGEYADNCPQGWTFTGASYSFSIVAEDFHGNTDGRYGGRITYRP